MNTNQVQFSNHAIERLFGRLQGVTDYATVQTVLMTKQLRNGEQRVLINTLDKVVTVDDPTATNGRVQGNKVYAITKVQNNNEVNVITIALAYN